jgi:hypothetical protein
MEEVLTQIHQDIQLVKRLNGSNDIEERYRAAERLAVNSYYLAGLKSDAYDAMIEAEASYDNAVAMDETNSTGPATKAKADAKNKNAKLNMDLAKSKGLHKRLDSLLSQTNVVVEQLRQTLSILKTERRNYGS